MCRGCSYWLSFTLDMEQKINELAIAKGNVAWLLEHEGGLVDMHGLVYWAERVEALRAEVKAML